MNTLSSKERLLAVLRGGRIDRFPWTALVSDYYFGGTAGSGARPAAQEEKRIVDFLRHIGADVLEFYLLGGLKRARSRVKVTRRKEGELVKERYETPVGAVCRTEREVPSAHTTFTIEPLVKDLNDVKVVKYIYEDLNYEADYETLKRHMDYIGDDGLVEAVGPASPIQEVVEELIGMEKGIYALEDYPKEIESLMQAIHRSNIQAYEILADSPAEIVLSCENTSTTYLSPGLFEKYAVPALNEYGRILHARNKVYGVHMCGHIKGLLALIKQLEIDGLESIGPPPIGDVELHEAFDVFGDELFIMGGISPVVVNHDTPAEILAYVKSLLERVGPRARLVVQVVDDLPPFTPLENLRAISEAVKDHSLGGS